MTGTPDLDLTTSLPADHLPPPLKALWWLKKGGLKPGPEWDRAHEICQGAEGDPDHDWVHGLCHLIEGDAGNAAYWFRCAGRNVTSQEADRIWQDIAVSLA